MSKQRDRDQLLMDLADLGYGQAESEDPAKFPKTFYPVAEHVRAFDPGVILVIGPRGSGKSELFRAVIELDLLQAIQRCLPTSRLPFKEPDKVESIAGYPIEREFPDSMGLARFLREDYPERDDPPMEVWFAYLVRVLWEHLSPDDQSALEELKNIDGGDIDKVYETFRCLKNAPTLALDRLDARLEEEKGYIFVGYDELDTLGAKDWLAMSQAIGGLVAFWAAYTRRWRRLRAKIFLRTDLFQRYATYGGPDLAKLAANRVELTWSDKNLYAMLLKRIANTSDGLWEYVKSTRGIEFLEDKDLGYVPSFARSEDVRPFVKKMAGEFMGTNIKKGYTHRWLLNHIRDGRGQALPRPLVRLIEEAARLQKDSTRSLKRPRLVDHISLRRALDKVSEGHVKYSEDEWPWLSDLKTHLDGQQVPWERRELMDLLRRWLHDEEGTQRRDLPEDNASGLVDYMVEVGIFRERTGGRIDVPDIFLSGLKLKRKGGVRKR